MPHIVSCSAILFHFFYTWVLFFGNILPFPSWIIELLGVTDLNSFMRKSSIPTFSRLNALKSSNTPGFMVRPRVRGHTFSKRIQARFLTFMQVLKDLVWLRHYFSVTFARKLFFDMTSTVWSHEGWHCHMVDSAVTSHRQCCHIKLRHYLFHI